MDDKVDKKEKKEKKDSIGSKSSSKLLVKDGKIAGALRSKVKKVVTGMGKVKPSSVPSDVAADGSVSPKGVMSGARKVVRKAIASKIMDSGAKIAGGSGKTSSSLPSDGASPSLRMSLLQEKRDSKEEGVYSASRLLKGKGNGRDTNNYWQGQLLLASPAIGDSRFERSIIYLCHQGKDGALGLVINKVAEKIQFTDVLDHLNIPFSSDFERISVHVGGPVESSRGFVLHSPDKRFSGTIELGSLAMTASADILKQIAIGQGPKEYVFLLGYAGWGSGQLAKEIDSNAWLHLPFDSELIFGSDDGDKWSRAMERLGISPHLLSSVSGNA